MTNSDSNSGGLSKTGKSWVTTCPHCTQEVVEHRQWLGIALVRGLVDFYHTFKRGEGKVTQATRGVTVTTTFSKLKYFGLIEHADGVGLWRVTDWGEQFVLGQGAAARCVWTHADRVTRAEERRDYINTILLGFDYRRDKGSEPVKILEPKPTAGELQMSMFEEGA